MDEDLLEWQAAKGAGSVSGAGLGALVGVDDPDLAEWQAAQGGKATAFPAYSGPTLASDPIGALTSADWWMSRPSGEKHTFAQGLIGPLAAANNAINPIGDETIAGGTALLDYLGGKVGLNDSVGLGDAYDQRLAEARGAEASFDKASPVVSTALDIAGALKLPTSLNPRASVPIGPLTLAQSKVAAPGLARIGQIAKEGAGWGAAFGFGRGEGGLENRLEGAKSGALVGGLAGATLGAPLVGLEAIAPTLAKGGRALLRKSVGARSSDYAKTAKELGVWNVGADDAVQSATVGALDDLERAGAFGKDRNPEKMLGGLLKQESELGQKVAGAISAADKAGVRAHPDFDAALQYLAEGKVPADQVDRYMKMLSDLSDSIKAEGKGKLSYLQQQKIAVGSKYDPDDGPANGFWRAVYGDIQRTIEKHVPDVAPINQELSKIKIAKPILQRNLSAEEAKNWVGWVTQNLRTSGGTLTTPTIIASLLGGGVGGPIGALGGAGLALASTPAGQKAIGKGMISAATSGAAKIGGVTGKVPAVASLASRSQGSESQRTPERKISSSQISRSSQNPTSSTALVNSALDRAELKLNADMKSPNLISAQRVSGRGKAMDDVTRAQFNTKVTEIAKEIGARPEHLMSVMKFETGGSLDSKQKNKAGSGATGLIQFMPATAKELTGAHSKQAAIALMESMTPVEQLDYVKKYLAPFKGKIGNLQDLYMAVLYPKAVGKDSEFVLFKEGTKAYWQNRGLDIDGDGRITKSEAASKVVRA